MKDWGPIFSLVSVRKGEISERANLGNINFKKFGAASRERPKLGRRAGSSRTLLKRGHDGTGGGMFGDCVRVINVGKKFEGRRRVRIEVGEGRRGTRYKEV